MTAETWLTAEEALDYGFIDEIEEEKKIAASLTGKVLNINGQVHDLSWFKNLPKVKQSANNNDILKKRLDVREKQFKQRMMQAELSRYK